MPDMNPHTSLLSPRASRDGDVSYVLENDYVGMLAGLSRDGLGADSRVLNIACEHQLVPGFLKGVVAEENVFGLEINREIVASNPNVRYCDVDADPFPFDDGTFDLIVSVWGIEHFRTDNVFRESFRKLKAGGRLAFIVPNRNYPVFMFNRLAGDKVGAFYYRRVLKSTYNPHKAFYLFNRERDIRRAADASGLYVERMTFLGPSNVLVYFKFSRALKRLVTLFERALTNRLLFRLKPYIICVMRKGGEGAPNRTIDSNAETGTMGGRPAAGSNDGVRRLLSGARGFRGSSRY